MCVSMAMMSTIATIGSTAMKMQQASAQGDYREGVAKYNARVEENEAQQTRNVATEKENIQRQRTTELVSKQRAQLGAANVDLGSGSALQLQEDALTLGEADALRIRTTGDEAFGALQTQAELTRGQGAFAQAAARNKSLGALTSGFGKVLDTGVADKWFTSDSAAIVE